MAPWACHEAGRAAESRDVRRIIVAEVRRVAEGTRPGIHCNHLSTSPTGSMKTKIVRIGNSRGIRIPKPLLEGAGLGDEVELRITKNGLVLERVGRARAGWGDAARDLAASSATIDSDPFLSTMFDDTEWEW